MHLYTYPMLMHKDIIEKITQVVIQSGYAKTSLSGTMECYHQSIAVDVYARHSQEGWSMICACLA